MIYSDKELDSLDAAFGIEPTQMPFGLRRYKYRRYRHLHKLTDKIYALYPDLPQSISQTLPSWVRQAKRHHNLSVPLMFSILSTFSKAAIKEKQSLPPLHSLRDRLRFAMRIASKHGDTTSIEQLISALKQPCSQWQGALRDVLSSADDRFRAREAAVVHAAPLSETIRQFIEYLSHITGYKVVPVRFDAHAKNANSSEHAPPPHAIVAYTDGSIIHLPAYLASTPIRELTNAFLICYLTAHEYLHLAAGSYRFRFGSRRGQQLFRILRPWRNNMKQRTCNGGGLSAEIQEKLASEGIRDDVLEKEETPDIVLLFLHFPNPKFAQWLFNAVEDGRLEALIKQRWPGLSQIHRAHDSLYQREVSSSPLASSSTDNLMNAIAMFAADRIVIARLTKPLSDCFEKAKRIIQKGRDLPKRSVYDSIATTRKLYLLIEKHLEEQLESEDFIRTFQPDVDIEEIAVRLALAERTKEGKFFDTVGGSDKGNSYKVENPGIWLPEWDGKRLIEYHVHVKSYSFKPAKEIASPPPLLTTFPTLDLVSSRRTGADERHWHPDGSRIATERLAEFRVQQRSGLSDLSLNYDHQAKSPPMKVTLLFDLSISMEAPRHSLGGDTPINRAIQAGVWLADNLEAQGVQVDVFGCVDGGRRLCQLQRIPQPISRHIPSMRCVGFGGFRLGAFVRVLDQAPPELGLQPFNGRHICFVFTDGDGMYLNVSMEKTFSDLHRVNCPTCTSRHRCRLESVRGGIDARTTEQYLFHPQGYAFNDIAQARDDSALDVKVCFFGEHPAAEQLDSTLGVANWFELTDPGCLPEVVACLNDYTLHSKHSSV